MSYVKIDKKLSEVSSMENSMRTSLGVLIGGVHTYFPKEIIRGISKEAEKLLDSFEGDKEFLKGLFEYLIHREK